VIDRTGIVYKWNELLNLLNHIYRILYIADDLYEYSICSKIRGMAEWDMGFGNNDQMGEGRVKILEEECPIKAMFVLV